MSPPRQGRPGQKTETHPTSQYHHHHRGSTNGSLTPCGDISDVVTTPVNLDDGPAYAGLDRALPTWAVNCLHNGVRGRNPDHREVFGKFVSIAMSARIRGWTEIQFLDEMWSQETRLIKGSRTYGYWPLLIQLITGAKGNQARAHRSIDQAWLMAQDNLLTEGTLRTTGEYANEAIENAHAWLDHLDDHPDGLSVTQQLVMRYVAESVIKRSNSKVTCPCREVGSAVGLHYKTANYVLRELADEGFLVLHDRGTHHKDPKYWRSALYSLVEVPSGDLPQFQAAEPRSSQKAPGAPSWLGHAT
jgi:hypothetical protein